jgi:hypothetical protein
MGPVNVNVGHSVTCQIVYLDQNGNPMLVTPTPDAPPSWSDAPNPAGCATLAVAADSLSAVDTAVAAGSDVVSLSLAVSGVTFSATLPVTIAAAPQVLTSIDIAASVS